MEQMLRTLQSGQRKRVPGTFLGGHRGTAPLERGSWSKQEAGSLLWARGSLGESGGVGQGVWGKGRYGEGDQVGR